MINQVQKLSRVYLFSACLCVVLSTLFGQAAKAEPIQLVQLTSGNFGGNTALIQSFDTSLGTLDSVNVTITGVISLTLATLPNFVPDGGGGAVPAPYPIVAQLFETFQGAAFGSLPPGGILPVQGLADGSGAPIVVPVVINTSFTFNATTDLSGFAIGSDGTSLFTGTRSDFAVAPFSIPLPETAVSNFINESAPPAALITWETLGAIIVQYNYTADFPVPTPVPEPATGALFLVIGFSLVAIRRRKHERSNCSQAVA